ncbi:hypothetical protein ABWK22_02010 [Gottfriedia acidiceleris]|uniref:hypothetical protein n=1 Tax=Gottfriedia acidiceleris TaxID=371036 RepID=UPI003393804A
MHEIIDVQNILPDELIELQPYLEKIFYIELDEDTQHHVLVCTSFGKFRFKNSLSYWVDYFNRRGCMFEKVHRNVAINLVKVRGYGWDNATFGPWWVDIGLKRQSINKRSYNFLNKSKYRHLNRSVKLRKPSSIR